MLGLAFCGAFNKKNQTYIEKAGIVWRKSTRTIIV